MISDEVMFESWRKEYDPHRVDLAIRIYDEVLIADCGAFEARGREDNTMRQQFVHWFAEGSPGREFRFQGDLGFGGKFWDVDRRPWTVSYYSEDRSVYRDTIEKVANDHLAELYGEAGQ